MPYLTVAEIIPDEIRDGSRIPEKTVTSRTVQPADIEETEDTKRIRHETMTLDQYYYATVSDSTARDHDQVLTKYLAWRESKFEGPPDGLIMERDRENRALKVFSVDQLWMWAIDDGMR
jgi:hypothetical protein